MTPYNHLSDSELISLVDNWPASAPPLSPLERELGARLNNAVEYIDSVEANLAVLAAKYQIAPGDLIECELDEATPPIINNLHGAHP